MLYDQKTYSAYEGTYFSVVSFFQDVATKQLPTSNTYVIGGLNRINLSVTPVKYLFNIVGHNIIIIYHA